MAVKTTAADQNSRHARDSVRQQLNNVIAALYYFLQNGLISSTIALQPGCTTATVTSKVKTAVATVVKANGVAVAVAATDNAWVLTGGDLAVASFRRYLLLVDAAGTTFTVQASTDAATKALCAWTGLPALGVSIVGILTVATDATHTFTPATTLLGAAGITATFQDGYDDSVILAAQVTV